MGSYRAVILLCIVCVLVGCNDKNGKRGDEAITDSSDTREPGDSADISFNNCYENFFEGLPRFMDSTSAFLALENGKRVSMTQFFRDEFMSTVSQYGKKDLDGDGVIELVVYNNTGGAHCCDEFYIFSQTKEKEFSFRAHILGGGTCVDAATNTFTFSFSETLGYFFACYACGFNDSTGSFKPMREIHLKYAKKLVVIPYNSAEEQQNVENLRTLQNHGFEKVEGFMDNGWRKEFAMNFAVWHYNHGQNWNATRMLFDQYYRFKDAGIVWKEFYDTLKEAAKENTF